MSTILVLNGPNLNLLGQREPDKYGALTLDDIKQQLEQQIKTTHYKLDFRQTNSEAELLGWVHQAPKENVVFILINPAAFTHTSIALRDALLGVNISFIELHISNVHAREPFRQHSYFSDIAKGVISGFGTLSYTLALQAAIIELSK